MITVAIFPPTAAAAVVAAVNSSARSGTVGTATVDLAPVKTPSSYTGSTMTVSGKRLCRILV